MSRVIGMASMIPSSSGAARRLQRDEKFFLDGRL